MSIKQTHKVDKIKKLIDLNGDTTNFEINFRVTSNNPFEILVVDQTTLDNSPNLEYKKVENGQITGNVKNDKNVYQNYFLILKADKPCECVVEIDKKEIPKSQIHIPEVITSERQDIKESYSNGAKKESNWIVICVVIFIILGVFFVIYYYFKNKKNSDKVENTITYTSSIQPSIIKENIQPSNSILDRLKRIDIE